MTGVLQLRLPLMRLLPAAAVLAATLLAASMQAAHAQDAAAAVVLDVRMQLDVRARQSLAVTAADTALPLSRRLALSGRLALHRSADRVWIARLVPDTLTVIVNGAPDTDAARRLRTAAAAPFALRLAPDGAGIDSIGTAAGTDPSFRQLLKDLLPLLAHPADLAAGARSARIAQSDGAYDVTWLPAEAPGVFTVRRTREPAASPVGDSIETERHVVRVRTGDPWPVASDMHRVHRQMLDGATLAMVARTLVVHRRADSPVTPPPPTTPLAWEPVTTVIDARERMQRINRTTLGDDTWESLREGLGDAVRDGDTHASAAGKLRALMTLHPANIDSVVVHATAPGTPEAQRTLLFNAVAETESDPADAALCTLFERLFGSGTFDEDLLVAVAMRARVPACMPPLLVAMHEQHADAWRRHHLALLASALLGRVRASDVGQADALLDTLLARPSPAAARARYIGNAARCADVPRLRDLLEQADRALREDVYDALARIRCAAADALLRTAVDDETDDELRRMLTDELVRRGMLPPDDASTD